MLLVLTAAFEFIGVFVLFVVYWLYRFKSFFSFTMGVTFTAFCLFSGNSVTLNPALTLGSILNQTVALKDGLFLLLVQALAASLASYFVRYLPAL